MSKWENSLNVPLLERARRDILEAHAERLSAERGESVTVADIEAGRAPRPRVLDPFAGGGAIPLEALRLGCETCASDRHHLCQPPADCLILLQRARLCKRLRCAHTTRRRPR
jgi:hypothetical protein